MFLFTSPGCIQLFYAEAASVAFPGRAPVAHRTEARAKPHQGQGWMRLQHLPSQQKTLRPWHLSCQASAEQPHAHAPRITSKRRAIERPQREATTLRWLHSGQPARKVLSLRGGKGTYKTCLSSELIFLSLRFMLLT